jgi:hypothetical protein
MLISEELIWCIKQYGRRDIQDLVARSQDIRDTVTYLQSEVLLEMAKMMSFVTTDLYKFERKTVSLSNLNQVMGQTQPR